jgi:hypothetical protein
MITQPGFSNFEEKMADAIEARAKAVSGSSWFDCARDVQTGSREVADQYGIEHVGEFVTQVAKEARAGVNTIRRYLALLDFVDRRVLPSIHLAPDEALQFVRANFSGLETISRIDKLNPDKAKILLAKLYRGEVTTRALEFELGEQRKQNPSSVTARRGQAISARMKELRGLEQDLERYVRWSLGGGTFGKIQSPSFLPAHWIFSDPERGRLVGYLSSAATSADGFEEAFVQSAFASRFFSTFFLVMPFGGPEIETALDALNHNSRTGVGLLRYGSSKLVELRGANQLNRPIPIEIRYQTIEPET